MRSDEAQGFIADSSISIPNNSVLIKQDRTPRSYGDSATTTKDIFNTVIRSLSFKSDTQRPEQNKLLSQGFPRKPTTNYGTHSPLKSGQNVTNKRSATCNNNQNHNYNYKPERSINLSKRLSARTGSSQQFSIEDQSSKWIDSLTSSIKRSFTTINSPIRDSSGNDVYRKLTADASLTRVRQMGLVRGSSVQSSLMSHLGRRRSPRRQSTWITNTRKASISISQLFILANIIFVVSVAAAPLPNRLDYIVDIARPLGGGEWEPIVTPVVVSHDSIYAPNFVQMPDDGVDDAQTQEEEAIVAFEDVDPNSSVFVERRRLNRDRSLEPAPWLREQPMRRGSEPPVEGEESPLPVVEQPETRTPVFRSSRQGSVDEFYGEILRQIVLGLLDGQAIKEDVMQVANAQGQRQQPQQSDYETGTAEDIALVSGYELPIETTSEIIAPARARAAKLVVSAPSGGRIDTDASGSWPAISSSGPISEPDAIVFNENIVSPAKIAGQAINEFAHIVNEPISAIPNGAEMLQVPSSNMGESFHVVEDIDRETDDDQPIGLTLVPYDANDQMRLIPVQFAGQTQMRIDNPRRFDKSTVMAKRKLADQQQAYDNVRAWTTDGQRLMPIGLLNIPTQPSSGAKRNVSLDVLIPPDTRLMSDPSIFTMLHGLSAKNSPRSSSAMRTTYPDRSSDSRELVDNSPVLNWLDYGENSQQIDDIDSYPKLWLTNNRALKYDGNKIDPAAANGDDIVELQSLSTQVDPALQSLTDLSPVVVGHEAGIAVNKISPSNPEGFGSMYHLGARYRALNLNNLQTPSVPRVSFPAYLATIVNDESRQAALLDRIQQSNRFFGRREPLKLATEERKTYWFHMAAILVAFLGVLVVLKLVMKNARRRHMTRSHENNGFFSYSPFKTPGSRSNSICSNVLVRSGGAKNLDGVCYEGSDRSLGADDDKQSMNSSEIDPKSNSLNNLAKKLTTLLQHQWSFKSNDREDNDQNHDSEDKMSKDSGVSVKCNIGQENNETLKAKSEPYRSSGSYIKSLVVALAKARSQIPSQFMMSTDTTRQFGPIDDENDEVGSIIGRNGSNPRGSGRRSNGSPTDDTNDSETVNLVSQMDISAAHLILSYMEKHLEDKERLRREWLELNFGHPEGTGSSLKLTSNDNKFGKLMLEKMARVALSKENRAKNRNLQVVPFDRNRVKLGSNPSRKGTYNDYINASYIYDDDTRKPTHIICQGPMENTVPQFWQMVWEQGVSVIVMLTRLNENNVKMCHGYWPTDSADQAQQTTTNSQLTSENPLEASTQTMTNSRRGSVTSVFTSGPGRSVQPIIANGNLNNNVIQFEISAGNGQILEDSSKSNSNSNSNSNSSSSSSSSKRTNGQHQKQQESTKFEVHLVSEHVSSSDYLVRNMYMINRSTGETRTITQFHYLAWPKGGVPDNVKSLLQFRRKVHKSYRNLKSPILVHCSDGAGRSGTYILIDMILERIKKGAKEIDPRATLEHLRDQRLCICATQKQFEFVLVALAEEIQLIIDSLPT